MFPDIVAAYVVEQDARLEGKCSVSEKVNRESTDE